MKPMASKLTASKLTAKGCKFYKPRDPSSKPNCANCKRWAGPQCINHLTLIKRHMVKEKFDEIERLMSERSSVEGPL